MTICLVGLAIAALGWRFAALAWPSQLVVTTESYRAIYFLLGLWFLGCGATAFLLRQDTRTRVFLLYAAGNGIFWGGMFDTGGMIDLHLLLVYLAASLAGTLALVHLALLINRTGNFPRPVVGLLYSPAALILVLAPFAEALQGRVLTVLAELALTLTAGLAVLAALLFVVALARATAAARSANQLTLVAGTLVLTTALSVLGANGLVLPASETWNLLFALNPAVLAWALVRRPRGRSGDSRSGGSGSATD